MTAEADVILPRCAINKLPLVIGDAVWKGALNCSKNALKSLKRTKTGISFMKNAPMQGTSHMKTTCLKSEK